MTRLSTFTSATAVAFLSLASACSNSSAGDVTDPPPEPVKVITSEQIYPTSRNDFFALVNARREGLNSDSLQQPEFLLGPTHNNASAHAVAGIARNDDTVMYYAFAGLNQSSTLNGPILTTGSVSYDADYSVGYVGDIASAPLNAASASGTLTLVADFTQSTLAGSDGMLTVDGTLTGGSQDFVADVSWQGVAGDMDGLITSTQILGAFQGSSDDMVYAGVLKASPAD